MKNQSVQKSIAQRKSQRKSAHHLSHLSTVTKAPQTKFSQAGRFQAPQKTPGPGAYSITATIPMVTAIVVDNNGRKSLHNNSRKSFHNKGLCTFGSGARKMLVRKMQLGPIEGSTIEGNAFGEENSCGKAIEPLLVKKLPSFMRPTKASKERSGRKNGRKTEETSLTYSLFVWVLIQLDRLSTYFVVVVYSLFVWLTWCVKVEKVYNLFVVDLQFVRRCLWRDVHARYDCFLSSLYESFMWWDRRSCKKLLALMQTFM